ncbi:unnamed protein product [Camellia sinensis]
MKLDHRRPEEKMNSVSPWKRKRPEREGSFVIPRHSIGERFDHFVYANMDVDIDTKRAALKASPSVVCLTSLTVQGGKMFACSGTIIECEDVNGTFISTILTSATLLRSPIDANAILDDIKSGIGGPLINRYGEVIGVNFCDDVCTPFLPINIVSQCLLQFKKNRKSRRPWLGLVMTNLYAASVGKLEKIISKFNISKGVLVEEVIKGSPAERAGILDGDVIVQCGKKVVQGFLEKVGKTVGVIVIRESYAARLYLEVFVDETRADKVNRMAST